MNNLGNKEIMATNIKRYMAMHNKSRRDMCEALGVKYTTFTDWVNGNSYPRIDKIEMMANYFGISKADLVEDKMHTHNHNGYIRIPVLGRVAAGVPIEQIEDIEDYEDIRAPADAEKDYFALRISGDSMQPLIQDGSIVIVHKQEDAESGEIVIATVNGDDATCKRLKKYAEGIMLLSVNPAYDPMVFNKDDTRDLPVSILGKVIEVRTAL